METSILPYLDPEDSFKWKDW